MSILHQVYDPHNQRKLLVDLIRTRTHNQISTDMAGSLADEIMAIHIDLPERENERRLAEIAVADAEKRADLAEVRLVSDNHKRKMYFLERGIIGIGLQTVFGDIHARRGVFNLMAVVAFICLIALSLAGCEAPAPRQHVQRSVETVYHLDDGRYAYEDDAGIWWFYLMTANQTSTTPTSSFIPAGGSWSQGTKPTQAELDEAEASEAEIAESPDGEPMTEAEAEAADTAADAADAADSSDSSSDAGSDSSSDAGSSDSGGGDSGGGGDGGGGGGE